MYTSNKYLYPDHPYRTHDFQERENPRAAKDAPNATAENGAAFATLTSQPPVGGRMERGQGNVPYGGVCTVHQAGAKR